MTKQITITTKTHNGGHTSTWTASEKEHIAHAQTEVARRDTELAGYSDHFGDFDDAEFPKFNDDGDQISGATEATIADAIAWFGHDVQSIIISEPSCR